MDKIQICRSLQNIINIEYVWEFEKFNGDDLYNALEKEMKKAASSSQYKDDALLSITSILDAHKKTISHIENNNIDINEINLFTEDLKMWKRKYILYTVSI